MASITDEDTQREMANGGVGEPPVAYDASGKLISRSDGVGNGWGRMMYWGTKRAKDMENEALRFLGKQLYHIDPHVCMY